MDSTVNKILVLALFGSFGIASLVLAQPANGQRIPDSVIQSISIKWEQDGAVINLEVRSPRTEYVLLELELQAHYRPCRTLLSLHGVDPSCPVSPERHKIKVEYQPASTNSATLELSSRERLERLELEAARGRPMTTLEKLRAKLR